MAFRVKKRPNPLQSALAGFGQGVAQGGQMVLQKIIEREMNKEAISAEREEKDIKLRKEMLDAREKYGAGWEAIFSEKDKLRVWAGRSMPKVVEKEGEEKERRIKEEFGRERFVDTGELVFPGVIPPPPKDDKAGTRIWSDHQALSKRKNVLSVRVDPFTGLKKWLEPTTQGWTKEEEARLQLRDKQLRKLYPELFEIPDEEGDVFGVID